MDHRVRFIKNFNLSVNKIIRFSFLHYETFFTAVLYSILIILLYRQGNFHKENKFPLKVSDIDHYLYYSNSMSFY